MIKPVCVKCHRFLKPRKCGVFVVEGMPTENAVPGMVADYLWRDYKLWACDLYECAGCGFQIFTGFGQMPVGEHFEPDFAEKKAKYSATFRINDC